MGVGYMGHYQLAEGVHGLVLATTTCVAYDGQDITEAVCVSTSARGNQVKTC